MFDNMQKKLLAACDSESVCDFIGNFAVKDGFSVKTICSIDYDCQSVVRECCYFQPDIVILGGGYAACEDECRRALLMADVYVLSLEEGKNRLAYPINIAQLTELLEKHSGRKRLDCADLKIDEEHSQVTVGENVFSLSLDELEVLKCFLANPNRVFSREQLAFEVFGEDAADSESIAENAVGRLKEKLDGLSAKWSLKLLWGVGYKFEVFV